MSDSEFDEVVQYSSKRSRNILSYKLPVECKNILFTKSWLLVFFFFLWNNLTLLIDQIFQLIIFKNLFKKYKTNRLIIDQIDFIWKNKFKQTLLILSFIIFIPSYK